MKTHPTPLWLGLPPFSVSVHHSLYFFNVQTMLVFAVDGKPSVQYFQRQNDGNLCQHSEEKCRSQRLQIEDGMKSFLFPTPRPWWRRGQRQFGNNWESGCVNSLSGLQCFLLRVEIVIKWNCLLFKLTVPESGRIAPWEEEALWNDGLAGERSDGWLV